MPTPGPARAEPLHSLDLRSSLTRGTYRMRSAQSALPPGVRAHKNYPPTHSVRKSLGKADTSTRPETGPARAAGAWPRPIIGSLIKGINGNRSAHEAFPPGARGRVTTSYSRFPRESQRRPETGPHRAEPLFFLDQRSPNHTRRAAPASFSGEAPPEIFIKH